jgi:hypothetical protein
MSTKATKSEPAATPDVVVENLRSAVHASEGELAAQVVADSALDSKLLGLLGFFAIAASILLVPDRRIRTAGDPVKGATMQRMDKPAPLPPPSGLPGESIPTGPSLGLWELLRRLIKSRAAA